jgi:hypothetical protein
MNARQYLDNSFLQLARRLLKPKGSAEMSASLAGADLIDEISHDR